MKAVLALSGGADSTTLLAHLLNEGHEVYPVHFQYGSKHNPYELEQVKEVSDYYRGVYPLLMNHCYVLDMTSVFAMMQSNLLRSGGDIPEGHYEAESMAATVIPGRNSIFATVLMGYAESIGANLVALGVHQGDHHIYPDCRMGFFNHLNALMIAATEGRVHAFAPLLKLHKQGVISKGMELGVPFEITRTCYKDQFVSCGVCGSCYERQEAFLLNAWVDPLKYVDRLTAEKLERDSAQTKTQEEKTENTNPHNPFLDLRMSHKIAWGISPSVTKRTEQDEG